MNSVSGTAEIFPVAIQGKDRVKIGDYGSGIINKSIILETSRHVFFHLQLYV